MKELLHYPFDPNMIIRKKKAIKKELLLKKDMESYRIAILGGSTTAEIRDILELFLLKSGIQPSFYESQYNRFYEEAVFDNAELDSFNPQFVIIHSGIINIESYPDVVDSEEVVVDKVKKTVEKFETIWSQLYTKYHCQIIQNNFELPHRRIFGNLDTVDHRGRVNYVLNLNREFSLADRKNKFLHINDVHYLSSMLGIREWFDPSYWFLYKYALSYKAIPYFCYNVSAILGAILGKSKKLLVVDLDNTLWGGVIGDDGVGGINLGKDTPEGEAFSDFQNYLKSLKNRGVMLAVCSKNEMTSAREGLSHPDSVLNVDDFASVNASWEPKDGSIKKIAQELNIGMDSIVFIDDNPAERELVTENVPLVEVPNIGNDVVDFPEIVDRSGFFETISISKDDINRNEYYNQNSKRIQSKGMFADHDEYLASLQMVAEIGEFSTMYIERITQLTNKTNQFNLTVRRYAQAEMEEVLGNALYIGLYGKMRDKFGDNGLVSVMLGKISDHGEIHIDLWVMSCRVFNRGMEFAMFDEFVKVCIERRVEEIYGYYIPSAKNSIVSGLYPLLGFKNISKNETGAIIWKMSSKEYKKTNNKIRIGD